jgi:hypothetical protein
MAAVGIPQAEICLVIGIDPKTLRKHYREDLDSALILANTAVGGALYSAAKEGSVSAIIWWEKTRAGRKDVLDLSSKDGSMTPVASMTAEQAERAYSDALKGE